MGLGRREPLRARKDWRAGWQAKQRAKARAGEDVGLKRTEWKRPPPDSRQAGTATPGRSRRGPSAKAGAKRRRQAEGFNQGRTGAETCIVPGLDMPPEVREQVGPCDWQWIAATEGDHRAARAVAPDLAGDPGNRQHLCPWHHHLRHHEPALAKRAGLIDDDTSYEARNRDPLAKIARQLGDPWP